MGGAQPPFPLQNYFDFIRRLRTHAKVGSMGSHLCASRCTIVRGFSLLELLVVIGTLMVLLGLVLPGMSASRQVAKLTRDLGAMRAMAQAVSDYGAGNRDLFPCSVPGIVDCYMRDWHETLVRTGYSDNSSNLMPSSDGITRVYMMGAAFTSPDQFDPHRPTVWYSPAAVAQRGHSVAYPSAKGLLFRATRVDGPPDDHTTWWCCGESMSNPCPVIFGDASGVIIGWRALRTVSPPTATTFQGYPVVSTWEGCKGLDR